MSIARVRASNSWVTRLRWNRKNNAWVGSRGWPRYSVLAGARKHNMVLANVNTVLSGATYMDPNLLDPSNRQLVADIAARYDVLMLCVPPGTTATTDFRDAVRAAGQQIGRTITMLRYAGTMNVRWADQAGSERIIPGSMVANASGAITANSDWLLKHSDGTPLVRSWGGAYMLDPAVPSMRTAAAQHCVSLCTGSNAGWDGIFLDEVMAKYVPYIQDSATKSDPDYPPTGKQYVDAKRGLVKVICDALTAAGKLSGSNVIGDLATGGFLPTLVVQDNPGLLYPFIEAGFGVDWDGAKITASNGMFYDMQFYREFLTTCDQLGRRPIINGYSLNADALAYAYAVFLLFAGPGAIFAGHSPIASDTYDQMPPWIAAYDYALGLPTGAAAETSSGVWARPYTDTGVTVDMNTGNVTYGTVVQLPQVTPAAVTFTDSGSNNGAGTYTIPSTANVTYSVGGTVKPAGTHAGSGTVTVTAAAASGYVLAPSATSTWQYTYPGVPAPAAPTGTLIFSDQFTGANGAAWSSSWTTGYTAAGATAQQQSGRGVLTSGTTAPGLITRRYTAQIGNFHLLTQVSITQAAALLSLVFRAAQADLDGVNAYALRFWTDQLTLVKFDASWNETTIKTAPKAHTAGTQYWLRVIVSGSSIRARSWATSLSEPSSWDVDATDTARTTGYFGWSLTGYQTGARAATIDQLTVAQS